MTTEVYMTVISGLIGVIGFFLTRSFAALDKKADKSDLEAVKSDVEGIRNTIADIKANSLTKEDFLRELVKIEHKQDKIMDILMEITIVHGQVRNYLKKLWKRILNESARRSICVNRSKCFIKAMSCRRTGHMLRIPKLLP